MVSTCANSTCGAPFRYLRAGKLVAVNGGRNHDCPHIVEYFWLCDSCSQNYDLRITSDESVELVAKDRDGSRKETRKLQPGPSENARLLETLRFELEFTNRGGYQRPSRGSLGEPSFFEDSPLCPNRAGSHRPIPCSACPLAGFIPLDKLNTSRACLFIPLDALGTTMFALLQAGVPAGEIESRLRSWLCFQIASIEQPRDELAAS